MSWGKRNYAPLGKRMGGDGARGGEQPLDVVRGKEERGDSGSGVIAAILAEEGRVIVGCLDCTKVRSISGI